MVGATEHFGVSTRGLANEIGSMDASILQDSEDVILPSRQDYLLAANLSANIVPNLWDFTGMADIDPHLGPYFLKLQFKYIGVCIDTPIHADRPDE
jgi:hypothetical protein